MVEKQNIRWLKNRTLNEKKNKCKMDKKIEHQMDKNGTLDERKIERSMNEAR